MAKRGRPTVEDKKYIQSNRGRTRQAVGLLRKDESHTSAGL